MAYNVVSKKSGKTYHLHARPQTRGGKTVIFYFFAGAVGEGALDKLPDGYEVVEMERTGLPMLKKKK